MPLRKDNELLYCISIVSYDASKCKWFMKRSVSKRMEDVHLDAHANKPPSEGGRFVGIVWIVS